MNFSFLKQLVMFWRRFLTPYIPILLPLIFFNMLPGFLLSVRPLVLAPVLGQVLPGDIQPAHSLGGITLDNLGATLQSFVGDPTSNLATAFLISGILYLGITLAISIIGGSVALWSMAVRLRILKDMMIALHGHLLSLPLSYFIKQKSGSLISRFSTDLTKTSASLETIFSGLMRSSVQLLIYTTILFRADSLMTIQVLIVGSLHILISHGLGGRVRRLTAVAYDGLASLVAALQETFQNIRIIKSFSIEEFDEKKIEIETDHVRRKHFSFMSARYLEEPVRLFADAVVTAAILYISYRAISEERMTMAGIALFFYMASQLVVPVAELSRQILSIYSVQGGFAKLFEIFNTQSNLLDGEQEIGTFRERIVFDQVSFRFDEPWILKNISLTINKGETIGIVGGSGSGKSTLIDLILRLNDPEQGVVTCDYIDIKEYRQDMYRKCFGIVTQECLLFNTSLRDNIILGRKPDEDDLQRACKIANIDNFVSKLPKGFDTTVGDRGTILSGGQRQRVAIARAVYAHPDILILDEATSALDTISERKVQKAINEAITGVTAVIVAHRLSTILHADKIVVLKDGRIEAVGSHKQLLETCQVYTDMVQHQLV